MLVRPLSTVDNTRDYTLVYPTVDSGLTITYLLFQHVTRPLLLKRNLKYRVPWYRNWANLNPKE